MQPLASTHHRFWRRLIGARTALLQPAILLLMLLLLSSCSESPSVQHQAAASPSATASLPSPTAVLPTSTPAPTPAIPGAVPSNCPASNLQPRQIFSQIAPVIGASPVWASGLPSGPAMLHMVLPSPPYPVNSNYEAPYGWEAAKLVWEVGPHYTRQITIQGHDIFDQTPLMIQFFGEPTANAILDPQHPDHPESVVGEDWAEWGSYLIIPKAGCYLMQVTWPEGHWEITLAAGA